ncbi:MAG: hypothetical protein Q8O47_03170, partial [Candidatus Bathyarchaeota archaeon]|nr:hypothetical protein [Candidatus Bathyarchaeota archaeon]
MWVDGNHRYLVPVHPVDEADILHLRRLQRVPEELVGVVHVLEYLDLLVRHGAEPLYLLPALPHGEADLPLLDGEDEAVLLDYAVHNGRPRHVLEQ